MTALQEQEERDALYSLWSDLAETVSLMRHTRSCDGDETICKCYQDVVLRKWIKSRDMAYRAYARLCGNPEQSASQEVVEAAIPRSERASA